MTVEQANLIATVVGLLAVFGIIVMFSSLGNSKKDAAIPLPTGSLPTGAATLIAGSPVCENASWVWRYASSMADNNVEKAEAALEHCTIFTTATPINIEAWSDKQRIAKITYNDSVGFTHAGAVE